jgi:streptogramin lyase
MRTAFRPLSLILGLVLLCSSGLSLALGAGETFEEADISFADVYEIHRAPDGTMVISDYGAGQAWLVDARTGDYAVAGVGRVTDAQLDGAGDLWWADGASSYGMLLAGGTSKTTWTVGPDRQLYGLAFDDQDRVWLSEWFGTGSKLYRFTPPSLGSTELCTYTLPGGAWSYYAIVEAGDVWLMNWWKNQLVRFTPASGAVKRWDIGEVSAERQGMAVGADGHLWWADRPAARLSRLDPETNEVTSYALPVGTTPQMVELRGGQIWYSEGDAGTVGILDPASAESSTTTVAVQAATAAAPVCSALGPGSSTSVSIDTGTLEWTTAAVSPVLDAGGWAVYELPAGAEPFGLAASGLHEWTTDRGRQKLARLATVDDGQLSLSLSASPATAYHGDLVTYSYRATYASLDGLGANTVEIVDDTCSPVVYQGGDGDGNGELDIDETWTFTCAYTVPAHSDDEADPLVNRATLTGKQASGEPAISDQDSAAVDLIHREGTLSLAVSPSKSAVLPGDMLVYNYALQYASEDGAPAQNLALSDDLCAPVVGPDPAGDVNGNDYLDVGETWSYLCQYTVPEDGGSGQEEIVNTATATGQDMDGDALAPVQDAATVTIGEEESYQIYLPVVVRLH